MAFPKPVAPAKVSVDACNLFWVLFNNREGGIVKNPREVAHDSGFEDKYELLIDELKEAGVVQQYKQTDQLLIDGNANVVENDSLQPGGKTKFIANPSPPPAPARDNGNTLYVPTLDMVSSQQASYITLWKNSTPGSNPYWRVVKGSAPNLLNNYAKAVGDLKNLHILRGEKPQAREGFSPRQCLTWFLAVVKIKHKPWGSQPIRTETIQRLHADAGLNLVDGDWLGIWPSGFPSNELVWPEAPTELVLGSEAQRIYLALLEKSTKTDHPAWRLLPNLPGKIVKIGPGINLALKKAGALKKIEHHGWFVANVKVENAAKYMKGPSFAAKIVELQKELASPEAPPLPEITKIETADAPPVTPTPAAPLASPTVTPPSAPVEPVTADHEPLHQAFLALMAQGTDTQAVQDTLAFLDAIVMACTTYPNAARVFFTLLTPK